MAELSLQVVTTTGQTFDLTFPKTEVQVQEVRNALGENDPGNSGVLCYAGIVLPNEKVITKEFLGDNNLLVLYDERQYPMKSYPKFSVETAFNFGQDSYRYNSLFKDISIQLKAETGVKDIIKEVTRGDVKKTGETVSKEETLAHQVASRIRNQARRGLSHISLQVGDANVDINEVMTILQNLLTGQQEAPNEHEYEEEDGVEDYSGDEEDYQEEELPPPGVFTDEIFDLLGRAHMGYGDEHPEEEMDHPDYYDAYQEGYAADVPPDVMDQYQPDERDAINRLLALGLDAGTTIAIYESCNRVEEDAIAHIYAMQ